MTENGFWTGGPDEHRRAFEQHIAVLRKHLENCEPDDREQIARQIDDAMDELKKYGRVEEVWTS